MDKERILYVSPFLPQKSGISDYSEILVYGLKKYYDIDLLIDDYTLSNKKMYYDFDVYIYNKDKIDFDRYKTIIYNIGNNPQFHGYIYELCLKKPGLIILHDFVIYFLTVGYYEQRGEIYSKLYELGGTEAVLTVKRELKKEKKDLLEYKNIASLLPLNKELINSSNKIMVHSEYAKKQIELTTGRVNNVRKINHVKVTKKDTVIIDRHKLFQKYGIPEDALIVASFGFVVGTKLNDYVCKAILNIQKYYSQKICYIMVGEGNFADEFVDNKTIFKTGYVELDEMNSFLKYVDIVANLRFPSMGETSGIMIRLLEYGKASIIIRDGWFAEIPDSCTVALDIKEIDRLESVILQLLSDKEYREKIGKEAQEYVEKKYSIDVVCSEIKKFIDV